MFDRAPLVASRHDPDTAFLQRRIIEVNDRGQHGVTFVRKIGIVLVHGKRGALLGWLNEQLVVMELHVRTADEIGYRASQALVYKQAREGSCIELHVVTMEQFSSLSDLLGAAPGGVDVGMLREPLDQGMRFLAKRSSLLGGKLSLDEQITILIVEGALLLCQHNSLPFLASQMRLSPCSSVYQAAAQPARDVQRKEADGLYDSPGRLELKSQIVHDKAYPG